VLRVYDRGSGIIGGGKEAAERPLGSKLKLVSSLTGHKNHNWPIKSAFHVGKDCTYFASLLRSSSPLAHHQSSDASALMNRWSGFLQARL
jgi:hypothetical protein